MGFVELFQQSLSQLELKLTEKLETTVASLQKNLGNKLSSMEIASVFDPFKFISPSTPTTKAARKNDLRITAIAHYFPDCVLPKPSERTIPAAGPVPCMITDARCEGIAKGENPAVVAAHILPHALSSHTDILQQLDLTPESLADPRNVLFLRKDIETAFDRGWVTFVPNSSGDFQLEVLAPMPYVSEDIVTLNGKLLNFPPFKKPFTRALAYHSWFAWRNARIHGWAVPAYPAVVVSKRLTPNSLMSRLFAEPFFDAASTSDLSQEKSPSSSCAAAAGDKPAVLKE